MKYIDAGKLIVEIERRIAQWQPYTFACASQIASEAFDRIDELKGLLIFITSLQQEQPSLPSNLDEAAEKNFETMEVLEHENIFEETHRKIFKAGAEWMAGQGETKRGVATQDHFIQFADDTYIDLDPTMKLIPAFRLKDAEEVVVQIRKKQ